jgi:hypothetical protein
MLAYKVAVAGELVGVVVEGTQSGFILLIIIGVVGIYRFRLVRIWFFGISAILGPICRI